MVAQSRRPVATRKLVDNDYLLLLKQVEEFFYYEADLLDYRRYVEWLDLLTDDLRYFIPVVRNVKFGDWDREFTRQGLDVAWFDEGKETLIQRVRQIETGIHWAEEPSSRISHLLTNIRIADARPSIQDPDEVDVSLRFHIYRNRLATETDSFVGKRLDTLRRVQGDWLLCRREVLLDQNVLMAKNLTHFF